MPPRHGKSELCSKYLPAWAIGTFPDWRVILTSYEAQFAAQWGRKARDILEEWGPQAFGISVSKKSSAADRWDIEGHEGGMQTAGAGGPITGKGAHLLIVDDPIKNDEDAHSPVMREKIWDWWQSTAYTRLEPDGTAIVIHTRWHRDDLIGRLLKQQDEEDVGRQWDVVDFPAIDEHGEALWPERFSRARLQEIERAIGPYKWSCLYQQMPTLATKAEWPESYWDDIWTEKWPDKFELAAIAVDPSKGKDTKKSDYSGIVFVGLCGNRMYVDADLARRPPSQIVRDTIQFWLQNPSDGVLLETNQFQELLAPEFARQTAEMKVPPLPLATVENFVNKEVRIGRLDPYFAQRSIKLRQTPGCKLLLDQLREWPLAGHDDGPDALEMAIRMLHQLARDRVQGQHETGSEFAQAIV